jgi:hypothetical protein
MTMATEESAMDEARAAGFEGFRSVGHLRRGGCDEVPAVRGVYTVLRDAEGKPEFLARSVGGWYRGTDPSVAVDALEARWVPGAPTLYIGRASGPGVRSLLQQRVKRYMRFGAGKRVAHWGGRLIWQLRDHLGLIVAWMPTPAEDPANVEARLLKEFVAAHGRPPFANLREEAGE